MLVAERVILTTPDNRTVTMSRLEFFIATYLSHYLTEKSAPFHRQWYSALSDKSIQYLCIEAGRGSAKSFVASIAYTLWELCEGDYPEIQTFSESGGTAGMSTKWMEKIKKELTTNDVLQFDYGVRPGSFWTQDHIQVIRNDGHVIDLYCRGKGSAARGGRGIVLIDDPQSEDDVSSETVLERDENWFLMDILPIAIKDQRVIFIGTPISPLSLLSSVKKLPGFVVQSFPAENPKHSGKSAWPEQWSDDYLALRKAQMGLSRYAAEYLCEPMVPGTPVWKTEWFKTYDRNSVQFDRISKDFVFTVTGFDGAESKSDQADWTALVTLSATDGVKPSYYVREVRRERWSVKEGAEQLLLAFEHFKQNESAVESRCKAPNTDAIIEELNERQRIQSKYINVVQVHPHKDKVTRASEVQSIVQEGRVYYDPSDPAQVHWLNEMAMFTGSQRYPDDCHDAFVHALKRMKERELRGSVRLHKSGYGGEKPVTFSGMRKAAYAGWGDR